MDRVKAGWIETAIALPSAWVGTELRVTPLLSVCPYLTPQAFSPSTQQPLSLPVSLSNLARSYLVLPWDRLILHLPVPCLSVSPTVFLPLVNVLSPLLSWDLCTLVPGKPGT